LCGAVVRIDRDGAHRFGPGPRRSTRRAGARTRASSADGSFSPRRLGVRRGAFMEGKQVRYRVESGKAILTIDREPARNALPSQVLRELLDGVDAAEGDPSARVIVITGAGAKVFSAGGDLGGMQGGGAAQAHEARRAYGELIRKLQDCSRPSI